MINRYGTPSASRYSELDPLMYPVSQSGCAGDAAVPHGTPRLARVPFWQCSIVNPSASENTVWATLPDTWPTAVTVKLRPASVGPGVKSVLTKRPWASATADAVTSGCCLL